MKDTNKFLCLAVFVAALAVNFAGINVDFLTDDQGLYASIAKNLVVRNNFFQLFTYNHDWLDKPHFPFWIISISFRLFGISVWTYRLPALMFFVLSLVYTYLFSKKYYGTNVAVVAVLILTTALNTQLSNTDVRAEPYLMALIMGSIYHISCLEQKLTPLQLLMAALLTACAIMTKGLFVLTAIYGGLIGQLVFNKKIRSAFDVKWLLLLLLTFLFTLPELYALYLQFDVHPEKTVFGMRGVSGIKWFLWDSQFGRFVNSGPISRRVSGNVFFYIHTLLWAFAPWCLLFYYAICKLFTKRINRDKPPEYYTFSGAVLLLLLFSLSRFQLPFYTNAIFPLLAIITAPVCCYQLNKFGTRFRSITQWIFIALLICAVLAINFVLKPANSLFFVVDCAFAVIISLLVIISNIESHQKNFLLSCMSVLFAGFYVNTVFLNELIPYNGQIRAAKFINQPRFDVLPVYCLKDGNNIFQFYCKKPVKLIAQDQIGNDQTGKKFAFYADQQSFNSLLKNHADFKILKAFINYPQENILPDFMWQSRRKKVLDSVFLLTN